MKAGIDARAAKWYRGTGIGTYTFQLINSINSIDTKNNYLLFLPEGCSLDVKFNSNYKLKSITSSNSGSFWDEVNIPNILEDLDVEIYHVPQNGVGLPPDKKCPFVITLHDVIPYKMPETVGERYLNIFNKEIPKIVDSCDGIITVSEYSKKDIMETFNFPENKIFVTYLAAEEIYKPLDKEESKLLIKKKYSIHDDFILYVGGFSPRKNITGLIEAYSLLPQYLRDKFKLIIAGKQGISYSKYKLRAEELHVERDVLFPGFIEMNDMPYLYNAAELFVYPSFYEGFGLPPVEAMACGIPVIASNVTSIPEICESCTLLIDPQNTVELKEAIIKVLTDPLIKNHLISSGLQKTQSLNWTKTANRTIDAYKKIIENI